MLPPGPFRSKKPPLTLWLFVLSFSITVIAVAVAARSIDGLVREQAQAEALRYLQTNAHVLRDALDRGMAQHLETVRVLASLDQVAKAGGPEPVKAILDNFRRSFPQFAWLGLTDEAGKVTASADGLLMGVDVSGRPWFKGAQSGQYVGDVHPAVLLEKLLPRQAEPWRFVDFAVPVRDGQGRIKGVLGTHLSWRWAAGLKQELSDRLVSESGADALVVGANGTVLLGPASMEGKRLEPPSSDGYIWAESRSTGHGNFRGLGWKIMLRQPQALALAPYDRLHTQTIGVAVLMCLLAAPMLWWTARKLTQPLTELTRSLGDPALARHDGPPLYREADLLQQALQNHYARHAEHTAQLQRLAASLEERVVERTAALATANDKLSATVAKLARSEERIADVLGNIPAMVGHFDREERCIFINGKALRALGLTLDQALGRTLREGLDAEAYALYAPHVRTALAGQRARFEGLHLKDGRTQHYQVNLVPERDGAGEVVGFYLMTFDITALKEAKAKLRRSEARLRSITDNLPVMISYIDREERLQFVNRTFELWTGISTTEATGKRMKEVVGEALYEQRREPLNRALNGERVLFEVESSAQGVQRCLQTIYVPDMTQADQADGVYTLTMDVTALRQAERRMAELALNDALTGLPNRRRLDERLPETLARARRNLSGTAVIFLDIDHFKSINDTHGHDVGDAVLVEFGARLSASVRSTDFVARQAGDEFVVVLEGLHSAREGEQVAEKIVLGARHEVLLANGPIRLSTSVGMAYLPKGASSTPDALLKLADQALYRTKARGRDGLTCVEVGTGASGLAAATGMMASG